ncbi:GPP34 family phosphoprotein [Streptomyces parvulus]|uniref:GPP34 family phosphoprotein n=1 Tax=Streptomyces parvulus TaxID=146923 RepID=A0A369V094_9ACTN|nr:GPP34 family phosphoprotein [Streptomyces parvulus]RDD85310.1 GPP34 family phosphoprotein [Streptomyces parvulus]
MHLTLPQRMYLLCYTVEAGKFEDANLLGRGLLLRAAAMAELSRTGLLATHKKKVTRLPAAAPHDDFLAEVFYDIPAGKPSGWLQYVHDKTVEAEEAVRNQLIKADAVTLSKRRLLGAFSSRAETVTDPQYVLHLRTTARSAVMSDTAPAAVAVDQLTTAVFLAECETTSVFTRKETRQHRRTLKAYAERFDTLVPGLRPALRDSFLVTRGG